MSATNGMAYAPILRLGDLTPDTRPVEVIRMGMPVALTAYVNGPRCPGYVKSKVSKARQTFSENAYTTRVHDDGSTERVVSDDDDAHYHAWLCEALLGVIEGLLPSEAEVLSGNQALAADTLRALGWIQSAPAEDSPPEAVGEAGPISTTAPSSPDSHGSTAASRRRRS
jgi:hypothetical protein